MGAYEIALASLNAAQRQAVETTEGPVLVIAGPGTGKTQLLTTRIAHILATTDSLPHNILCLTFTDSAAATMRARLSDMIGQAAYDVTISTYHAFGSELIRRFPDYFAEDATLRPADDLAIDAIFRGIIADLPYNNPLKYADNYLADIKTLVSDAKRALLTPADLRAIATANLAFIQQASPIVAKTLEGLSRIDKKSIPLFRTLREVLTNIKPRTRHVGDVDSRDSVQSASRSGEQTPRAVAVSWSNITHMPTAIQNLKSLLLSDLEQAVSVAEASGKTQSLTKWKNTWLAKNADGQFILDGAKTNQKLLAAAAIYAQYLKALKGQNLFDYDDMILRAVRALATNADLRFTLQEQYLYILLDEFQDTNGAQLRLVELLTDNPVNEGRPNVLAVGDDDQAIYAFQGANYSHMLQFRDLYRDVTVVPLTENYRSHADILHTARGIAEQIEERLHHHFPAIEKNLTAAGKNLPKTAVVERREAQSDVMQFAWTAARIRSLIDAGVPPSEIAVLAPQHKFLEPLVPFLQQANIPVRYEKREDVLSDPAINQLLRMAELALALGAGDHASANALWAQVLSFGFWELPTSTLWQLSWRTEQDSGNWTDALLADNALKPIALFFIRLGYLSGSETLETMLDYLIGTRPCDLSEPGYADFRSPYYEHYFGDLGELTSDERSDTTDSERLNGSAAGWLADETLGSADSLPRVSGLSKSVVPKATRATTGGHQLSLPVAGPVAQDFPHGARKLRAAGVPPWVPPAQAGGVEDAARETEQAKKAQRSEDFWTLLTNLIVLRARLREYRIGDEERLTLPDFVQFVTAMRAAELKILNTSPYASSTDALQLMTAFKAKGMEFQAVFVLAVNDEAWGSKSRTASVRIGLPPNLQFIRYAGATNDERLRLFYVAITRAKSQLYLVNYTSTYAGKPLSRLRYLSETADEHSVVHSPLLPPNAQLVLPAEDATPAPTTELAAYWSRRHEEALAHPNMQALLQDRLSQFRLSPSRLNDFTNFVHSGPQAFFLRAILRFPEAPRPEAEFGYAMHETLEWIHHFNAQHGKLPSAARTVESYAKRLRQKQLSERDLALYLGRGEAALRAWLEQRGHTVSPDDKAEFSFAGEGVFAGQAHLTGKADKLIVDRQQRTITIVDYKTGKSHSSWKDGRSQNEKIKLHRYRQQLYLYKTMVEKSHSFAGYRVLEACLAFVEPDEDGQVRELHLEFSSDEQAYVEKLADAVWHHLMRLELPDTSGYSRDLAGIEAFEHDLIDRP